VRENKEIAFVKWCERRDNEYNAKKEREKIENKDKNESNLEKESKNKRRKLPN
jgi:hypothetical protein